MRYNVNSLGKVRSRGADCVHVLPVPRSACGWHPGSPARLSCFPSPPPAAWRTGCDTEEAIRKQIVRWLTDTPSRDTPLSIHHIAAEGAAAGVPEGKWFGPNDVSFALR